MTRWLVITVAAGGGFVGAPVVGQELENERWLDSSRMSQPSWEYDYESRREWTPQSDWERDFGDVNWENDPWLQPSPRLREQREREDQLREMRESEMRDEMRRSRRDRGEYREQRDEFWEDTDSFDDYGDRGYDEEEYTEEEWQTEEFDWRLNEDESDSFNNWYDGNSF